MPTSLLLPLVAIVSAGVALSVQAPVNAVLAQHSGGPLAAATISFVIGTAALVAIVGAGGTWSTAGLAGAPWWAWIGGILGAFYVSAVIWTVPKLGVVTTFTALILGQMIAALLIDAVGAFGVPIQPVTWQRIVAVVMVCIGVILSRTY
jgi:transporter family-2 protein